MQGVEQQPQLALPKRVPNCLPADLYRRVKEFIEAQPLKFGAKSNSETDPYGHLSWKPVHDSRENLADISIGLPAPLFDTWEYIKRTMQADLKLIRAYVNGYTYGMDGYFHRDSENPTDLTLILYLCDKWEDDWGGETCVRQGDQYWSMLPAPNTAVLLRSNMMHCARAVSRKCKEMRTVLVFKMRQRRMQQFEYLSQFLVEYGALKTPHGKGTLHDHLMRTHQLVWSKGGRPLNETAATAAGLHSIYGTNAFKHALFQPSDDARIMVARKWGREVEELVYLFSIVDRPMTLETAPPFERDAVLSAGNLTKNVSRETFDNLRLIECANLLDQGSLDKWPNLKKFWGQA